MVEELLSRESRPAQLCRRYDITSSLLYHWKRQYSRGRINNKPSEEGAVRDRVEKLERLVGKLTLSSFYHRPKDKSQGEMEKEADLRGKTEAIYG